MVLDIGSPSAKKEASNGLPPCHGPKLYHFSRHDASITWIGRLDRHWENGRMNGEIKSHVFKVEIGGRPYAIKVFTGFDDGLVDMFRNDMVGDFDSDDPSCYTLPFHNECRAYGRLREAKKAGTLTRKIAVQCHGYIRLEDGDIQALRRRRMPFDGDDVYGIVKDLTGEDTGVDLKSIQRIREDIALIKSLGIYIGNIREDSYRGGLLVDFCSAITEPHPRLVLENESVQRYDSDAWGEINKNLVYMSKMQEEQAEGPPLPENNPSHNPPGNPDELPRNPPVVSTNPLVFSIPSEVRTMIFQFCRVISPNRVKFSFSSRRSDDVRHDCTGILHLYQTCRIFREELRLTYLSMHRQYHAISITDIGHYLGTDLCWGLHGLVHVAICKSNNVDILPVVKLGLKLESYKSSTQKTELTYGKKDDDANKIVPSFIEFESFNGEGMDLRVLDGIINNRNETWRKWLDEDRIQSIKVFHGREEVQIVPGKEGIEISGEVGEKDCKSLGFPYGDYAFVVDSEEWW